MTTTTPDAVTPRSTSSPPTAAPTDTTAREDRFTAAVRSLRTRVSGASIDRWFRLAGPVLIPLGALMILLGWWGAANTTRIYLQIPYLISGGVLGLGFMFVGGFVYFARWLNDLLDAVRAQTRRAEEAEQRSVEALERIESLLQATTAGVGAHPGPAVDATRVEAPAAPAPFEPVRFDDGDQLVSTEHGKLVHKASCRLVAGRDTHLATAAEIASSDECRICQPEPLDA